MNTSFPVTSRRNRISSLLLACLCLVGFVTLPAPRAAEPPPGIGTYPPDDAFPGVGPLRSHMDWFRQLWVERRSQWWRDRDKDRGAVVFIGDSITQGWDTLAKDFPKLKVANRGISGDVTRGVRCRLPQDALDLKPRALVLLIGTNDLEEGAKPETIVPNILAIVTACRQHDAKLPIVVCKVMPSHASMKRPADAIRQINTLLAERLKDQPGVSLCETWKIFADADGNATPAEFPDLLHLNAAGYAKWAAALRPHLEALAATP